MALRNIKDRIASITEGENLGSAKAGSDHLDEYEKEEREPRMKREKKIPNKKEIKQKVAKPNKPSKPSKFSKLEKIEDTKTDNLKKPNIKKSDDKVVDVEIKTDDLIDGYKDIMSMLGIKEVLALNLDFTSQDLDYVEFTQTQPLGFDFDEVTDFISRIKYNLYKFESALRQRDSDIKRLASEVKRVEEKMIATNQQKELDRMIGGMTEEERLIEENMDLKVQLNEIKRSLISSERESETNSSLMKRIEALQIENDILKSSQEVRGNFSNKNTKLPPVSEDEDINDVDIFTNMLEDIGGLYDE